MRWQDVDLATGILNLPDSKTGKKSIRSGRRRSSCWPRRRASRAASTCSPAGGAYHGLVHLVEDEDGAEFLAVFTHGRLESVYPITGKAAQDYRLLGRGWLWAANSW